MRLPVLAKILVRNDVKKFENCILKRVEVGIGSITSKSMHRLHVDPDLCIFWSMEAWELTFDPLQAGCGHFGVDSFGQTSWCVLPSPQILGLMCIATKINKDIFLFHANKL